MFVEIASRFDPARPHVQAKVHVDAGGRFDVSDLTAPVPKVREYYEEILRGEFDFSFIDHGCQQPFYGIPGCGARNFLLCVANEAAQYGRDVRFTPSTDLLSGWMNDGYLELALLNSNSSAIPQVQAVLCNTPEAIPEFSGWLYFVLRRALFSGQIGSVEEILRALLATETEFTIEVLHWLLVIDPDFLVSWAPRGAYGELRKRAVTQPLALRVLFGLAPANDARFASAARRYGELGMAARRVPASSVAMTNASWEIVSSLLAQTIPNPMPAFLPRVTNRGPATIAIDVLRHFNFELPGLDEVAAALGTKVVHTDLPNEILGLFVGNPEAHDSAILVNRSVRNARSQRFTLAHELGHYLIHADRAFLCGYREIYEPNQEAESQANKFAAELLMPSPLVREYLTAPYNAEQIASAAQRCWVSTEAAARRIIDLAPRRQLAFFVVIDCEIAGIAASTIDDRGRRWVGRPSVANNAVSTDEALTLRDAREVRLERFFPCATAEWLQDLEIDIYPFRSLDGYYMFAERTR